MPALAAIEEILVSSNARFVRAIDIYWLSWECYSECAAEPMAHPWLKVDPKNRNIFKVTL